MSNVDSLQTTAVITSNMAGNKVHDMAFEDIPPSLKDSSSKTVIKQNMVNVTTEENTISVYYQEPEVSATCKTSILLLHGRRFMSQTWCDLGTLQLAGAMGIRAVAVDLPGFGETSGKVTDTAGFLSELINQLGLDRPVLVSPSMSGMYALPFLLEDPTQAEDKLRGYIPIAPIDTEKYSRDQYASCSVPTLIVYGSEDHITGQVSLQNFQQMPNSTAHCFQGAGHCCYLDQPDLWHKVLYNYFNFIEHK